MGKPYAFHSLSVCAGCGCTGEDFGSVNVEAFELTGELYCEECADEAIEAARDAAHQTLRAQLAASVAKECGE